MQWFRQLTMLLALVTVVGCGEGTLGDSPVVDPDDPNTGSSNNVELQLWDCPTPTTASLDGCTETRTFSFSKDVVVQVLVTENGAKAAQKKLQVTTDKGSLSPGNGEVITDSQGQALLLLNAGNSDGVVTLNAGYDDVSAEPLFATIEDVPVALTLRSSLLDGEELSDSSTLAVEALITVGGEAYSQPVTVAFSSLCAAEAEPLAAIDGSVQAISGSATATYRPDGCQGQDSITATVTIGLKSARDTLVIPLADTPIGSLVFESAEPEYIYLRTSGKESSTLLTFLVTDQNGKPKQGVDVDFELASGIDRVTLGQDAARSNSDGKVFVNVQAGDLPGSARILATVNGSSPVIAAVSANLAIGTGLPELTGFSLASEKFNVDEAWHKNNVPVKFTINAGDHFKNPVPDGTSISFIANTGLIEPNCTTAKGTCTVTWWSSGLRPADGRVAVLAFAEGQESFVDLNGNGLFDTYEEFLSFQANATWFDIGEAFVDGNGNGTFDLGEQLIDRDNDQAYTPANGIYNGLLCTDEAEAAAWCSKELVDVHNRGAVVMSGRDPQLELFDVTATSAKLCAYDLAADGTRNALPGGTAITIEGTEGVEFVGPSSFTQQDTLAIIPADCTGGLYTVTYKEVTVAGEELSAEVTLKFAEARVVEPITLAAP